MRKYNLGFEIGLVVLGFLLGVLFTTAARSEHPPQHQTLHDKFYSHWNMPDRRDANGKRYRSCCNNEDCFPTQFRRERGADGGQGYKWYALTRDQKRWIEVPNSKIEDTYPDAEESPDGQGHVCMSNVGGEDGNSYNFIYCAVLGSGT